MPEPPEQPSQIPDPPEPPPKTPPGVFTARWAAPLPPPSVLEGYEKLLPGSAERIISMAESELRHAQEMDRQSINSGASERRLGQIFAFILAFLMIAGGVFLTYNGHDTVGVVMMGGTLVGLVAVFVYGRKLKKKESSIEDLQSLLTGT